MPDCNVALLKCSCLLTHKRGEQATQYTGEQADEGDARPPWPYDALLASVQVPTTQPLSHAAPTTPGPQYAPWMYNFKNP